MIREVTRVQSFIYTASIPDERPANLLEQLTLDEARDGQGHLAMLTAQLHATARLTRWYGAGTWVKMRYTKHTYAGVIVVHYFRNMDTGRTVEFKFKRRLQ